MVVQHGLGASNYTLQTPLGAWIQPNVRLFVPARFGNQQGQQKAREEVTALHGRLLK